MTVEEIAIKIKNGEIEAVMSLELNPVLLEQAQLVAEMMENGEMIPKDQEISTSVSLLSSQHGVKRSASPTPSADIVLVEELQDDRQPKHKKLKISLVKSNHFLNKKINNCNLAFQKKLLSLFSLQRRHRLLKKLKLLLLFVISLAQ